MIHVGVLTSRNLHKKILAVFSFSTVKRLSRSSYGCDLTDGIILLEEVREEGKEGLEEEEAIN